MAGPDLKLMPSGTRVLNVLATAAMMAGALAMCLDYGYYVRPLPLGFLRGCQYGAAAIFVLELFARCLMAENRRAFVRRRWPDLTLFVLLLAGLAVQYYRRSSGAAAGGSLGASYLLALQLYIAGHIVLGGFRLNIAVAQSGVHPARLLVTSFLVFILLGAAVLRLPRAVPMEEERITWVDALFTSTSAMCVTGLSVRATGTDQIPGLPARLVNDDLQKPGFTLFGQAVIIVLIQLGGLGIMIFGTIFAVLLGQRLTVRHGLVVRDMLSSDTLGQIGRVVRFVFLATFLVEGIGAALVYSMYSEFNWPVWLKLFNAVFLSVAAFCNAGFSLTADSLVRYHGYWQVHGVIAPLIVLGGLGFPVLLSLTEYLRHRAARLIGRRQAGPAIHLNLHSRLVLWTTALLVTGGMCGLLLLESPLTARPAAGTRVGSHTPSSSVSQMALEARRQPDPHQLRAESPGQSLADAWFMSVTARTAGFNTVDMDYRQQSLSQGSYFLLVLLMMIGGSPASTAGGMKTVAFAILVLTVVSVVRGREHVECFGRSLPADLVKRAATVAVCYVGLVITVALLLTITETPNNPPFMPLLLEAASGCGTVGLTAGITPKLTEASRYVMILAMFAGRTGPLTLLIAVTFQRRPVRYELPQERAILG